MLKVISFPSGDVRFYFDISFDQLLRDLNTDDVVLLTNEHIARLYPQYFNGLKTVVVPAGEHTKNLQTIEYVTKELLTFEATRETWLIGVGGGVITDITGFVGSTYMRGIKFGFVPTSLLGMVDAAVGGKNGVNIGLNKNILGTIKQPGFICYDMGFMTTLPSAEWSNGFAEIIKYACIYDESMFLELSKKFISFYKEDTESLQELIEKCVMLKSGVVSRDEIESGARKLLNFGHTAGHAIENLYELPHGHAVSIGMIIATMLSETILGLPSDTTGKIESLLKQYYLPTHQKMDVKKVMDVLKMDKKRNKENIDFILLQKIGKAIIHTLSFKEIETVLDQYASSY